MYPTQCLQALACLVFVASFPLSLAARETDSTADRTAIKAALSMQLSLEAALTEAFANSPVLRAARAEIDRARGRLVTARTFPHNPELEIDSATRRGAGGDSTDRGVRISQQLEIAGQRGKRETAAEFELDSIESTFRRTRRSVAATVAQHFARAVTAKDLVSLAETESGLTRELLAITERRVDAGTASQINLNLALASAARAERRSVTARAIAVEARSLLAEAIGLDPTSPPDPASPLALPANEPAPLQALVAGAIRRRDDLKALEQARLAAEARLRLAKAEQVPDLSIGAFYEEEAGVDRIMGAEVGITIPIFNRAQGAVAETTAAIEQAAADATAQDLAVRREVVSALVRYQAARSSAVQLGEQVVGNLAESLSLLERSFTAGKIGLSDLLVFRRELIEARREHIEATAEAWLARIALDLALGRLPASTTGAREPGTPEVRDNDSSPETHR